MASPETLIAALQPLLPCSMGTLIPHLVDIENEIKKTIDALVFISSAKPGVALAFALESAAREVTVYVATNGDIAPDALERHLLLVSSNLQQFSIAANDDIYATAD